MADLPQFAVLLQGVAARNACRSEHSDVQPELTGADLENVNYDRNTIWPNNRSPPPHV